MNHQLLINETLKTLGEAVDNSKTPGNIRDFIRKTFGVDTKPISNLDSNFYTIFKQDSYKIKDQMISALYSSYSIKIEAGADDDGNVTIMVEEKYEHVSGGRNGKTTRLNSSDGGKTWKIN